MPLIPEFALNADPRCACVLLLDTSGSMDGAPIKALNEGLKAFERISKTMTSRSVVWTWRSSPSGTVVFRDPYRRAASPRQRWQPAT
jgi:hypothetical protein